MSELPIIATRTATPELSDTCGSVLFVDLDGTLISTDSLHESVLLAVKRCPQFLLRGAGLLLKHSRAAFKCELAAVVQPDATVLPYRPEILNFIREQRALGRRIVLATATDRKCAQRVADYLGLFDAVLASDSVINLKAASKLTAMQEYCRQFGFSRFGYVGDSNADLIVWQGADEVHIASSQSTVRSRARQLNKPGHEFTQSTSRLTAAFKALRPEQWAKNLLLFVPLVLSHQIGDQAKFLDCCWAFIAFCAFASAVYLMNDLLDIESDRHHPTKRRRPFAAGTLPVIYGPLMAALLIGAGLTIALTTLPQPFFVGLLSYAVVNVLYSLWLKQKLALDVILLASMYALRVVVGGLATEVHVSEWLLAFSLFLFTSLAFAKRYAELLNLSTASAAESAKPRGRGYGVTDLSMIESIGPCSGYMAVLVLALYINSQNMQRLYSNSWALWLICPLMMYWLTRTWFIAKRGELQEDPLVFAIRDKVSIGIGILTVILGLIATRGPIF